MRTGLAICAILAAGMFSSPAWAATPRDRIDCDADDPPRKIRGCSAVILEPNDSATNRALAFYKRGFGYAALGDLDRAIADLSEAIKLNPNYALAFNERGIAYENKGEPDLAIADFTDGIRLDPGIADIHYNRGNAHVLKGDLELAIADYDEAIRLGPRSIIATTQDNSITRITADRIKSDYFEVRARAHFFSANFDASASDYSQVLQLRPGGDVYAAIWLFLARARSGHESDIAELRWNLGTLKEAKWPRPVIELFLGTLSPDATLAAATKPGDRCEAQFYVGEWHLLRGDRQPALAALKVAAGSCSKDFLEYQGARAELKNLEE
jgi:lipoprotein NlpI